MHERLGLRLRFALFFMALAAGGLALLAVGLWLGHARAGGPVQGYVVAGLVAGFGLAGLAAWIGLLFDENVARPILALSAQLKTRARAEIGAGIDEAPARYLGALAPAANAIQEALADTRAAQDRVVAERTAALNREKAMFEALLRDLAEGVVVATPDHRLMLYNRAAQALLGDLGLDRPLTAFLRPEPLSHALDRMAARGARGEQEAEQFLAATACGERFLMARVSPFGPPGQRADYVLIFHDATEDLQAHAERDHLLNTLLEAVRRPAAALGALLDAAAAPDLPGADRSRFHDLMCAEQARLVSTVHEVAERHGEATARHWPMPAVASDDIADAVQSRLSVPLGAEGPRRFVRCDGFAVTELLARVAGGLAAQEGRGDFVLGAEAEGREVRLTLGWCGPDVPDGALEAWLAAPLSDGYGQYTGRDVLEGHGAELWSEPTATGHRLVLPLRAADAPDLAPTDPRPEFYDFSLPAPATADQAERPLSDLSFVVFDTETTGLSPRGGDEIVQIAGVRIVNGRVLRGEVFDTLVNPGRHIPAASTAIHGIDDARVRGAPDLADAARRFHAFCDGAVLVAHNAAFDMAFLRMKEDRLGLRFDHPVLCTVLLSAALYPHAEDLTLDALAVQFGMTLLEAERHTALGDALATAEVFRHMLGELQGAGVETLGQALAQSDRMRRIRRAQNY
ncbi:exonuclease domain-containing protein [Rhodovulum adriaticum]|uniref:DNA-directed DNA polymerase n=1 Tax=Rhodovulum adriaticum TaxID=35804 RepID=A0A4R2NLE3_RHOAD|nr:exonuclease domain-containing protein [Rhodovulum adriaticum]MBK1637024.1 exonuclease [Rhodovulum adriaticum]TCP22004.1 DNA polymerase-3 subunit epsilon [Rhodovulum adriaticum]